MKKFIYASFIFFTFSISKGHSATKVLSNSNDTSIDNCINQLSIEIMEVYAAYQSSYDLLYNELSQAKGQLKKATTTDEKIKWLLIKEELKDDMQLLRLNEKTDLGKIRYLKGIQIIKILYEKTLALDHHFTTVTTLNEINKMTNLNNYPEVNQINEMVRTKKNTKTGFDLTEILGNNIYASAAHSLISLFTNGKSSRSDKENQLKEIECILDFTLEMNNDLNTIYFETVFLKKNNDNIIAELEQLFVDYSKPISYSQPLKECRNSDDWDSLKESLDEYLKELNRIIIDTSQYNKAYKMQVNLEFPVDRLLQFITQYNSFINQGSEFYEKFGVMLDSYQNKDKCFSQVPIEFKNLKVKIDTAIDKFNTTYKPVEINGSKLKELLYGINEYD